MAAGLYGTGTDCCQKRFARAAGTRYRQTMDDVPFVRDLAFEYAVAETLSPLVRRVVARNPGPFTAQGTGTFIVGRGQVAVIDPGPDLAEHVDALIAGLRQETVTAIAITHTHRDHSPAAAALKRVTGAKTYGFGPHGSGRADTGPAVEEGADTAFTPDERLADGAVLSGPGWDLAAVHTPGHTSNHLCFALAQENILFTGDHVMGWSTTVVSPPDGDMRAYMDSLARLLPREDALYVPTHGPAIRAPQKFVRGLIRHRKTRHAGILRAIADGRRTVPEIVAAQYVGLDPRLVGAAGRSVLAHLIAMVDEGAVVTDGAPSIGGIYRLP